MAPLFALGALDELPCDARTYSTPLEHHNTETITRHTIAPEKRLMFDCKWPTLCRHV